MPGLLDYQAQPPAQPQYGPSDLLRFLGMQAAPNLTSLLTGQQAPPIANLPEQGKVPSVDPRMMGAAFELPGLIPGPGELAGLGVAGVKALGAAPAALRFWLPETARAAAPGVADLWHGISQVKLPRPIAEMSATHVPTAALPGTTIAPEALQGGMLLPAWGDRSAAGSMLTHIGEQPLAAPVEMQGGHGFMPANVETGAAWASGKPVVGRLAAQTRNLAETGAPVYFPYTAMGERSVDFSHHMSDALAGLVQSRPLPREAASAFDAKMRAGGGDFGAIEDWPGLRSSRLREFLVNAPGDVRNKFAKTMDTAAAQQSGLPSVAEARYAVTDPQLLNTPTGGAGLSIAKLDPTGNVITDPTLPHRTYAAQLGGQYIGGFGQSVPKEFMYPTMLKAYQEMGYKPQQYDYLMQRGVRGAPIAQPANQEWVDTVSKYLELKRQGQ